MTSAPHRKNNQEGRRVWATVLTIAILAALVLLAWANRKLHYPCLDVEILDALRTRDAAVMFLIAPIAALLAWILLKINDGTSSVAVMLPFVLGVYTLGVGFGMHEPANALRRVVETPTPQGVASIADSLEFFDDALGHWVFFAGFAFFSVAVCVSELRNPLKRPLTGIPSWVPVVAATALAAAIYGDMADEKTKLDIAVILGTAFFLAALWWLYGKTPFTRLPATTACVLGYVLGAAATLVVWLLR
jgi:hypothetical protein